MKIKNLRHIIFLLLIMPFSYFALLTTANAGELYRCIDEDGKEIISSIPQDGMKCELKESYKDPSAEKPAKDNAIVKAKETSKEMVMSSSHNEKRINNCMSCCNNKMKPCYNYTANSRLCRAEHQNCVATCKSEGSSPSLWSDCWSQSEQ